MEDESRRLAVLEVWEVRVWEGSATDGLAERRWSLSDEVSFSSSMSYISQDVQV
jgi:hypothetical protein